MPLVFRGSAHGLLERLPALRGGAQYALKHRTGLRKQWHRQGELLIKRRSAGRAKLLLPRSFEPKAMSRCVRRCVGGLPSRYAAVVATCAACLPRACDCTPLQLRGNLTERAVTREPVR
eukprot:5094173-Pleurochrysis_carterae.AAC.1